MGKIKVILAAASLLVLVLTFNARAIEFPNPGNGEEPQIVTLDISTDKESYTTLETIWFNIIMGGEALVDIYMAATFPDGSFASYTASLMPDGENAIIPLVQGFPVTDAEYTLPLPVIPLWPEGTSEIWMIFVQHQQNPLNPANWMADDKVVFDVFHSGEVDPFFDLETRTFTAELGEMGTMEVTFDQGNIHGLVLFTGEDGNTYALEFGGTYRYEEKVLKVHLEGEHGFFFIDFELGVEEGILYGDFTASTGTSGSITFNPETREADYSFERRTWRGSLEELGEVTVNFEEGQVVVTLTAENQDGELVQRTLIGSKNYDPELKTLTIDVSEEGGEFFINIIVHMNEDGLLVGEYESSGGKSGSVELAVLKAILEHLGIVDNTYQIDLGDAGTLLLVFEQGKVTGVLSVDTVLGPVERSIVVSYAIEGNSLVVTAEGEGDFSATVTLTYADGTLTGSYETGRGQSGSTEMTLPDIEG